MIFPLEFFFKRNYKFIVGIGDMATLAADQMDVGAMPCSGVEDFPLTEIVAAGQSFFME